MTIGYVEFPDAPWAIEGLPQGVYPLPPASRTWEVSKYTKIKVRRTGFFLVPDFASTAHMIQGQSLEAAFADVVNDDMFEAATEELHVTENGKRRVHVETDYMPRKTFWGFAQQPSSDPGNGSYAGDRMNYPVRALGPVQPHDRGITC